MPGPGTFSSGDVLTAADFNAIVTWTSYSPVVAQNTAVAATVNYAEYCVINIHLKIIIISVFWDDWKPVFVYWKVTYI
jgi:hypothetical protein